MMAFSSGVMRYFYPRPPRGRRRENIQCEAKLLAISIHALREEGDHPYSSWERGSNEFLSTPSARRATIPRPHLLCWHHDFYPRPPRGGRLTVRSIAPGRSQFLSTPSARRATPKAVKASVTMSISIHALREEGDRRLGAAAQVGEGISIHALREEGDRKSDFYTAPASTFLSTPSARRATSGCRCRPQTMRISIHALREEGDPRSH